MNRRWRRWGWALFLGLGALGAASFSQAEFNAEDFDAWYYSAPTPPDERLATEALNYFVHLTGTAATRLSTDKEYRLFIASRARFFAAQGAGRPSFWRHAESLFPQCFWSQKPLLLEIFKRTREPGVAESLSTWARSEEDDDRRLILEEAALSGSAPEAILEKPLTSPQIVAEQWAYFLATGSTGVVEASLAFLKRNPVPAASGNSSAVRLENLMSPNASLRETVWEKLEQFSRAYPGVRRAFQDKLLHEPLSGADLKRALGTLAWQALDAGDTLAARALLPLVETAWSEETEARELFKGELAVLDNQPGEVESEARRLGKAEPLWADRLGAFQARVRWLQESAGLAWGAPESGGEKYGHLAAKYLRGLKACRTCETLTVLPLLVSWDEKVNTVEQVKSLQMPKTYKGWQRVGQTSSAWKIENGELRLWAGAGRPWAEVRDPEVRARVQKAALLDAWIELLDQQHPRETRETAGPAGWVRLGYEAGGLDLSRFWGDTARTWKPSGPEGNASPWRLTVDLSKTDGRVAGASVEITDADGRRVRIEKLFFDQNFTP